MSSDGSCPLDVASAIVKDNLELALALTEDIFKQVMVLMEKMTYGYQGSGTESESDTPSVSSDTPSFSSMSMEWSPFGSLKCLKFLYAAVWVNGKCCLAFLSCFLTKYFHFRGNSGSKCVCNHKAFDSVP